MTEGPDRTMVYMTRFGCIGPACEENCCQDGWRIDVNKDGFKRLMAATQFAPRDIAKRVQAAIRVVPPDPKARDKAKRKHESYIIKQDKSGACPLFDDGWCAIHKNFGLDMLPHVCAIYPRKLVRVTDSYELTATASCPEVARQILLHDDGADLVPLDISSLNRVVLQESLDTRDTRPFYRALIEVRDAMMDLARDPELSFAEGQLLSLWFAHRTSAVLNRSKARGDLEVVDRELELIANPRARRAILERFADLETPAAVAVYIASAIVRPKTSGVIRPRWNKLVRAVLDSLSPAARAAATGGGQGTPPPPTGAPAQELLALHRARRERLHAIPEGAARMERYFRNYTLHTWFHRFPTEEKDLLQYVLRMLAQQACQKMLVYDHPDLSAALDRFDAATEAPGHDREAAAHALLTTLDGLVVDAFYQLARHIEHGSLIKWLVTLLEKRGLASIAGGVYLIRF